MPEPFSGAGVSIAYSRAHPYLKNKRIEMYEDDLAECPLCRDAEPGRRTTLGRTLASEEGANVQTWAVEMRCGDCNRTYTVDERRTKLAAGSSAPTHRARPWGIPATCSGKGSWSGTTPKGLEWSAFASAFHDSEDNDTSCSLTMGPLKIASSEDCGRTWGEYKASVSHDVFGTVSSRYTRSVSSTHTDPLTYTGSSTVVTRALAEIAEREGLSVDDVLSQLGGFGRIAAGLMKANSAAGEGPTAVPHAETQQPAEETQEAKRQTTPLQATNAAPPTSSIEDRARATTTPAPSSLPAGLSQPTQRARPWGIPARLSMPQSRGGYARAEHTLNGKTPKGLEWSVHATHCYDSEDNDRTWALRIGELSITKAQIHGSVHGSDSMGVSHTVFGGLSSREERSRSGSKPTEYTGSAAEVTRALAEIAEHEGVSVDEVMSQLGTGYGGIVAELMRHAADAA